LFVEASYFRIVETAFEDNVAWKQAGAIFAGLNPSYVSLSLRSALSKGRATDMSTECRRFAPTHVAGGAIMLIHGKTDPSPAELVLNESTLAENTALVPVKNEPTGGYGGAIFVARNVELTVQGCRATSNTVEGDAGTKGQTMAGGFTSTCSSARVTLSDSHFVANQAKAFHWDCACSGFRTHLKLRDNQRVRRRSLCCCSGTSRTMLVWCCAPLLSTNTRS
jgi:hypothetical protein